MSIVWIVLAFVCLLAGIAGCIVPVLPGPPLSYAALWLMKWSGTADFDGRFLLLWGIVTLAVTVADYLLPAWLSKRFGGSKYAATGSLVGLLAGMFFFPPLGPVAGAFLGALAGELLYDSSDTGKAFKAACGAFVAFLLGTGLKLGASLAMGFYVVKALFV
ncbi:DUF456 domain-containing protein [uncultured Alistipes sp.]|uniref:DUF456 domain-containing protein n=1 Tax=uncultured Alistipes sp. TaxID=538949 RepID=UPI00260BF918|nr:DUF456 domain-containing protein [uncultured Alistipes sp.]